MRIFVIPQGIINSSQQDMSSDIQENTKLAVLVPLELLRALQKTKHLLFLSLYGNKSFAVPHSNYLIGRLSDGTVQSRSSDLAYREKKCKIYGHQNYIGILGKLHSPNQPGRGIFKK